MRLVRIANRHAEGMLIPYLVEDGLAFVADLWSPGRDKLGAKGGVGQYADLVKAVDVGPTD